MKQDKAVSISEEVVIKKLEERYGSNSPDMNSGTLSFLSRKYDLDGDGSLNETEAQLREMDHGDGHLDIRKVYEMLLQQKALNKRVFNMKRFMMGLTLIVVILALSNLGTAWVAATLAKDTELHHGILVQRGTHEIIKTDNVVRHIETHSATERLRGRRNQEGVVATKSETTITRQAAANLFDYCAEGPAVLDLHIVDGQQVVQVCPADFYMRKGSDYLFRKGEQDLLIACSPDVSATDSGNAADTACTMSGSMLIPAPTLVQDDAPDLFGGSLPSTNDAFAIPTYTDVLLATYEDGSLNSGIEQLTGTHSVATDAAYLADFGARSSNHSICHRARLDDTNYYDLGIASSQSDTLNIFPTRYAPGTEFVYKFSLLLKGWQEYETGPSPMDVIWQFQHTEGEPDAMLGLRRNALVMRYGKSTSRFRSEGMVIADMSKYRDQWIELEAHIRWEYQHDTGFIRVRVQTPDDDEPVMVFQVENFRTFTDNGSGDFGYVKWGMYRPESTMDNTPETMYERVACHDNVQITAVTYS